jgi:ATP-binding cassette subfamily B multidrug efflux pump
MEKFKRGLIFFMIEMLKTLGKSVREYKKTAIITPFLVTLEVIMEVIIPLLMAELIDKGIYAGNMNQVLKIGVLLVVTSLLSLAFGMLSGVTASKASAGFAKNLRKDLYYKIQNFSFTNIDKFSTSSIVTRLTTDVSNVQMAFQMITRIVVRTPLMLIFSLVMSFTINAELSLIFLGLIPVIGIVLYFIISRAHPIFEKVFQKYDSLNNVVEENTSGIRVVKSYLLEESEKKKFGKISNEIYMDFSKAQKLMSLTNPVMQFAMYSAIILISWLGAKIIVTTNMVELEVGQLTSLITYGIRLLTSLMMLTMLLVMSTMARNSAERIYEILIEELDLKNPKKPVKEIKDGSIEFDNVSFSYIGNKKKECLKNINIKIKSGETVGIIGGIGSGKSTLVNLIPRLYDATEGTVKVGGKDVKKYDIEALRNEVSVVLQKNVLFSGSIKDNLRWGDKNATDEEMIQVCKLAQADEFIQEFPDKYDTYIEQGGTNVSGGQRQRLCIARALLKKPKILILDDSTSAVDTKTDSLIRKAFKENIPNTTKIIIAQRISSVQDADKIIVLDNGTVNGTGTHEELLKTNEIYKEVYESQVKGGDNDENA